VSCKKKKIGDLKKTAWQRATRTDKGVHAVANVISCKIAVKSQYLRDPSLPAEKTQSEELKKNELTKKIKYHDQIDYQKILSIINSDLKAKDMEFFCSNDFLSPLNPESVA